MNSLHARPTATANLILFVSFMSFVGQVQLSCRENILPYNNKEGKNWVVSLFNGITTFVGYLMPKPFSEKNSGGTI